MEVSVEEKRKMLWIGARLPRNVDHAGVLICSGKRGLLGAGQLAARVLRRRIF